MVWISLGSPGRDPAPKEAEDRLDHIAVTGVVLPDMTRISSKATTAGGSRSVVAAAGTRWASARRRRRPACTLCVSSSSSRPAMRSRRRDTGPAGVRLQHRPDTPSSSSRLKVWRGRRGGHGHMANPLTRSDTCPGRSGRSPEPRSPRARDRVRSASNPSPSASSRQAGPDRPARCCGGRYCRGAARRRHHLEPRQPQRSHSSSSIVASLSTARSQRAVTASIASGRCADLDHRRRPPAEESLIPRPAGVLNHVHKAGAPVAVSEPVGGGTPPKYGRWPHPCTCPAPVEGVQTRGRRQAGASPRRRQRGCHGGRSGAG